MTDCIIRKSIFLNADRQTVWAYLTDPDKLAIWFHAQKTPLTEGQPMKMFSADTGDLLMWSDVIVGREPEYLEYTFIIKPLGYAVSTVDVPLQRLQAAHS